MPFFSSWLFLWGLLSVFLWNGSSVFVFCFVSYVVLICYLSEIVVLGYHYLSSFIIFVFSEGAIFFTLLFSIFWYNSPGVASLASFVEYPLIGTMLLFTSSITASGFHHSMGSSRGFLFLKLTILLGILFILVQYAECRECCVNIFDSSYVSSSLCVVGLHFTHVLVGVVALIGTYKYFDKVLVNYYHELVIWYWHFVDYIWFLVYVVVYVM